MKFLRIFQHEKSQEAGKRIVLMIATIALVIFCAQGVWQLYQKAALLQEEQEKKEAELAALVKERERLESDITYLKSDGAIEREAKSRLNYKKTGEEVVIVVPGAEDTKSIEAIPEPTFWEKVWGKITSFFK